MVRDVFDQLPIMIAAFTGPEHVHIASNAPRRAFLPGQQLIGRTVREVVPEVEGQQIFEALDRVHATGEPVSGPEWRLQLDLPDVGLQEFFVDVDLSPLRNADGSVHGVVVSFSDVTERVRQRVEAQARALEAEQRYRAARDVVVELQGALLQTALPVLPGASLAARYLVAAQDQAAGGDWFDAVALPDGRVGLVVGDVVGHGVAASAAMGQLRAVLNRALVETSELTQAIGWADRLAATSQVMRAATLVAAIFDPGTGALHYATCGHPPPLAVTSDGASRFLPASGGGPLGTGSEVVVATEELALGEVLVLYSDGLVERPGQSWEERSDTLARVAGDAVANRALPLGAPEAAVERATQQCVELMTIGGYDDDVTVLALERRPTPVSDLAVEESADTTGFRALRSRLRDWLGELDVDDRGRQSLELAAGELVANVVDHAYPPGAPGTVRLRATLGGDGVARVEVADDGVWREPPGVAASHTRGRGLWMAGAVVDSLDLRRDKTGTVVTIRHRLLHPAVLADHTGPAPRREPGRAFSADLDEGPPRSLRVAGAVDVATAADLADRIATASRGGVHALVIDLRAVDVLASAGVGALFDARDAHETHGHALTVLATPDSVPALVLGMVGLDFTAVVQPPVSSTPDP